MIEAADNTKFSGSRLGQVVGENSQRFRRARGISLSSLARRSGVARATLYHLEAGEANPTLETLNSVASVLGVTLSDLVNEPETVDVQLVRASEANVLSSPGVEARLLKRLKPGGVLMEVYELVIEPEHLLSTTPHRAGVVEHLLLHSGRMLSGPVDALQELHPGDFISFRGDVPHAYQTRELESRATLLMQYPRNALDD